jgi:hypothetical protein
MSTAHWQARRLPILAARPVRSSPAVHPWAIISAGLAPILLTGAYLIAGILQPASYSPVRMTISVMAGQAGTDRWVSVSARAAPGPASASRRAQLTPMNQQGTPSRQETRPWQTTRRIAPRRSSAPSEGKPPHS